MSGENFVYDDVSEREERYNAWHLLYLVQEALSGGG
jgi:hypothetical protein